jgi:hypothetical protein
MEPQVVHLFGMRIRSDIPLPGPEAEGTDEPDVVIELGAVAASSDPVPEILVDEHGATLTVEGVAKYRISNGRRVVVQPVAGVPEANVRLFLLGSAMGLLLHQRGLLPLHASAVEIDGRAVAFTGPSGSGKSTLAAAFHDRGHRVIADDICVIGFDGEGKASAYPGIPRMRLWEEALAATGRDAGAFELSYAGDESFRKFDVPVRLDPGKNGAAPLAAVLDLCVGEARKFRPIVGSEAADVIFANTYRGEYLNAAGHPASHWRTVIGLVRDVPIFELSRPRKLGELGTDVDRIAEFIRQGDAKAG